MFNWHKACTNTCNIKTKNTREVQLTALTHLAVVMSWSQRSGQTGSTAWGQTTQSIACISSVVMFPTTAYHTNNSISCNNFKISIYKCSSILYQFMYSRSSQQTSVAAARIIITSGQRTLTTENLMWYLIELAADKPIGPVASVRTFTCTHCHPVLVTAERSIVFARWYQCAPQCNFCYEN